MRQVHHSFPVQTSDLTECKLNRVIDPSGKEHLIVSYPIEWKVVMEAQTPNNDGQTVPIKMYEVTAWEEAEIEPINLVRMKK